MRINNNLMAMNTHRQMGVVNTSQSKSMEKLSSGYRINRAGDDAAGLAISEKMRAQVRGLNQASRNAQDGISMIQTAEGALNETQNILQRMRELAVQSANDTNVDADRTAIQNEITQLTEEIDRIADTTEFNTQSLLKGTDGVTELKAALSLSGIGTTALPSGTYTTSGGATIDATGAKAGFVVLEASGSSGAGSSLVFNFQGEQITVNVELSGVDQNTVAADGSSVTISLDSGWTESQVANAVVSGLTAAVTTNTDLNVADFTIATSGGSGVYVESVATGSDQFVNIQTDALITTATDQFATGTNVSYTASQTDIAFGNLIQSGIDALVGQGITINGQSVEFYNADSGVYTGEADFAVNISSVTTESGLADEIASQLGTSVSGVTFSSNSGGTLSVLSTADGEAGDGIEITDGVDIAAVTEQSPFTANFQIGANESQTMEVSINDMRALALGVEGVDISTSEDAQAAITTINDAITSVSDARAKLGAFQNRLEHTIANLDTSAENLQASESRIRDVDMAKEMMEFTKNNILTQAAQSMLAQANQAPQGVLQLLR